MPPTVREPTPEANARAVPQYRPRLPSRSNDVERTVRRSSRRCTVLPFTKPIRSFVGTDGGLATIEYIIGAAVVLGTLVVGVQAWNNGLVARLQALVTQMGSVR